MLPPRSQQLASIAKSYQPANQQAAERLRETQALSAQAQLVKDLQAGQQVDASQLAAQTTTQARGAQMQAMEQTQKQAQQVGQLELAEQRRQRQESLLREKQQFQQVQRELEGKLHNLDARLKKEVLDDQLKFKKDEMQRTFFNERQMADWLALKARSMEEFRDYEQKMTQLHKRKMTMLKVAQAKIEQTLKQEFQKREQERDQELTKRLTEAKRAMQERIAKQQRRARNTALIIQGVCTVAGAVAGGPTGALLGAAIGSAVGGAVGTAVGNQMYPVK